MSKKKPIGFVAVCQCGEKIGAMDYEKTDSKDAGRILGKWITAGCTVEPRFPGWDSETITPCKCD